MQCFKGPKEQKSETNHLPRSKPPPPYCTTLAPPGGQSSLMTISLAQFSSDRNCHRGVEMGAAAILF